MKHTTHKQMPNDIDKLLLCSQKNYEIGNFYQTRKLARLLMLEQNINAQQKMQVLHLLKLTSIDKLAFSAGLLSVLLTAVTAFLVRY